MGAKSPNRTDAQRAKHAADQRAWVARNRDKVRASNRQAYRARQAKPEAKAKRAENLRRAAHRRYQDRPKTIHARLRRTCRAEGIPFDLTIADLAIPERCPLLGIPIVVRTEGTHRGPRHDAPSVDRLDPTKGYVRGNVWVVSMRANAIKQNASLEEIETLARNLRREMARRFRTAAHRRFTRTQ